MPRSLVIGNGNVLVGFDASYSVRDIYFPRVGDANQTMGNVCRTGFFIDGKFAWLDDPAWDRRLGYAEDSLVSDVTLTHPRLGVTVKFADFVDLARNWFIRNVEVKSPTGLLAEQEELARDVLVAGAPLSVSPLTSSHAELIVTVDEFCRRSERVRRSTLSTLPPKSSGGS